jgi:hypothetical protein
MEQNLNTQHRLIGAAAVFACILPDIALAQTVSQFFGIFNAIAGIMLVVAILLFIGGFIIYLVRLGIPSRVEGLNIMQWGVMTLFVLAVMLGIIELIQYYFA